MRVISDYSTAQPITLNHILDTPLFKTHSAILNHVPAFFVEVPDNIIGSLHFSKLLFLFLCSLPFWFSVFNSRYFSYTRQFNLGDCIFDIQGFLLNKG